MKMNVFDFYKEFFGALNWFGKITVGPIFVLAFPIFLMICIGFKKEK
jgi:hypothetical protein